MADGGKRIALVIGNADYVHASKLENPLNDARDIAASLTRIGFSGISEGHAGAIVRQEAVLPFADLDFNRLRRVLALFARAAENAEQAILYYAGHGIEVNGQNYLLPVDARLEHARDVDFETASLMQVLGAVEGAQGLRLVILDACRDNPFRRRLFAARGMSRGLREVEPGRNILVAYAAKHGTVAMDGDEGNSPYASALLQHMENPGLEIMDMFREVKDAVLEATGERQEPYVYGSLGRRREYLVKSEVASSSIDWTEQVYWSFISASEDPSDFERFLTEYPGSRLASLARRNSEKSIRLCRDANLLRWFVSHFPDSPRCALAAQRAADLMLQDDPANERLPPKPQSIVPEELPAPKVPVDPSNQHLGPTPRAVTVSIQHIGKLVSYVGVRLYALVMVVVAITLVWKLFNR